MLSIYPSIYSPMKFVGPYGSPTNLAIVHITLLVVGQGILLKCLVHCLLQLDLEFGPAPAAKTSVRREICLPWLVITGFFKIRALSLVQTKACRSVHHAQRCGACSLTEVTWGVSEFCSVGYKWGAFLKRRLCVVS